MTGNWEKGFHSQKSKPRDWAQESRPGKAISSLSRAEKDALAGKQLRTACPSHSVQDIVLYQDFNNKFIIHI